MGIIEELDKRIDQLGAEVAHLRQDDMPRLAVLISALEARCQELENEHSRVDLLQGWTIKHNKMTVDDHRDKERPAKPVQQWRCPARDCKRPPQSPFDCLHRGEHSRNNNCGELCYGNRCQPVPAQEPVKPAPELVRCEDYQHCFAVCCYTAEGDHRRPHERRPDCERQHCDHGKARCIPVPASPEIAVSDQPVQVGSVTFRREFSGHMQKLAGTYRWNAYPFERTSIEVLRHLAGIACELRDIYKLAGTGETDAALSRLREIKW